MKKLLALLMALAMVMSLAACGGSSDAADTGDTGGAADTGDTGDTAEPQVIKIGCVAVTEPCVLVMAEAMKDSGYTVESVVFDGNNLPAEALNAGDIDGLFCNSLNWMNTFNAENNAELVMAFPYYYSINGLYSAKWSSPEEFPDGAQIVVSNGLSNIHASLLILQNAGLITLADEPSENDFYSILDIVDNPKNIELIPSELTTAMSSINDVDGAVASSLVVKESGVLDPGSFMALPALEQMSPQGLIVNAEDENAEWVTMANERMHDQQWYDLFNEYFEYSFILYDEIDERYPG